MKGYRFLPGIAKSYEATWVQFVVQLIGCISWFVILSMAHDLLVLKLVGELELHGEGWLMPSWMDT